MIDRRSMEVRFVSKTIFRHRALSIHRKEVHFSFLFFPFFPFRSVRRTRWNPRKKQSPVALRQPYRYDVITPSSCDFTRDHWLVETSENLHVRILDGMERKLRRRGRQRHPRRGSIATKIICLFWEMFRDNNPVKEAKESVKTVESSYEKSLLENSFWRTLPASITWLILNWLIWLIL